MKYLHLPYQYMWNVTQLHWLLYTQRNCSTHSQYEGNFPPLRSTAGGTLEYISIFVFVSTVIREINTLCDYRYNTYEEGNTDIYFDSGTSLQSTSQVMFIWVFYVVGLIAENPKADLPFIRPHSIFILVRGSYEVFFFQRKVERTVEMLRWIKVAATRLLTQFSVLVKGKTFSWKKKKSSKTHWWCHEKPNVKATD